MAADLHIHVLNNGCTEDAVKQIASHCFGSKYFDLGRKLKLLSDEEESRQLGLSDNIWIGEVSWLKAAVFADNATFVPSTVQAVQQAISEDFPVLDDELTAKILAAFDLKNDTNYSIAKKEEVEKFLQTHKGRKLFTISW